ncbi:primosome assembly protein PriA [Oleiphilus messinensis]|uniref:Replication restart protein PriA n=2 Tax=Oleiphilus messinensis TaxID=141451 RepID=A0A1Y0I647_9GAMM|nr:primosome assembly protein PriA [Oleiphilus messinensis]
MQPTQLIKVALPIPLKQTFDYQLSEKELEKATLGARVKVPFGNRQLIGLIVELSPRPSIDITRIKPIIELIDESPVMPEHLILLLRWASKYYQASLGEALFSALPPPFRHGKALKQEKYRKWQLNTPDVTAENLNVHLSQIRKNAEKQKELLTTLSQSSDGIYEQSLRSMGFKLQQLKTLKQKKLITDNNVIPEIEAYKRRDSDDSDQLLLNDEQKQAVQSAISGEHCFQAYLLKGITGSGKTEVYLEIIEHFLVQGYQALVLVPEINLTPQTLLRFQARLPDAKLVVHHSGMNNSERLEAWHFCQTHRASVLIGTRSAVFYPFKKLGCIIIDEEHDTSYKQQDGFRYHARDIAVKRAKEHNCPVILGSATPSLESYINAREKKYKLLTLNERPGSIQLPQVELIDIQTRPLQAGLARPTIKSIESHLKNGHQVLVFLNRRGFAPTLTCTECGWIAKCNHCDARLTYHNKGHVLRCHHCNYQTSAPNHCQDCHQSTLKLLGQGTQQTEAFLEQTYPDTPLFRIDRDSVSGKHQMETLYHQILAEDAALLVGTQMLAKGHHFPKVTLVVVVAADDGLFSADFRAEEKFSQLLIQVSGRAGRAQQPGQVIIQTRHSHHAILQAISRLDYDHIATTLAHERELMTLPPFSAITNIRGEGKNESDTFTLLQNIAEKITTGLDTKQQRLVGGGSISGPLPSLLPRKADRYRFYLTLKTPTKPQMQKWLSSIQTILADFTPNPQIRISLDIDPVEIG